MQIAVIGGGAAGFFAAINCAELFPEARVTLLEKSSKLLTKVRVSGGGRCNVTHDCHDNSLLAAHYPRGEKQLPSAFSRFAVAEVVEWFGQRGVMLKTEEDGRMFPVTNDSLTIVNCFLKEAERKKVDVRMNSGVVRVNKEDSGFSVQLENGGAVHADRIIIAAGGYTRREAYDWIAALGHKIIGPVPSLFTFNIPGDPITELMGVAAAAKVSINGTRLTSQGPLLITHWGMSGPAVLKLSSWGARKLNELNYHFTIQVSWLPKMNEEKMRLELENARKTHAPALVANTRLFDLPRRLWEHLAGKCGITEDLRWGDVPNRKLSALLNVLLHDEYAVKGKTTFKEEFVTCGGVDLREIDLRTMESKLVKGVYFAGEVLDIDGVTGGFNFQSAWTTAMIAARNAGNN